MGFFRKKGGKDAEQEADEDSKTDSEKKQEEEDGLAAPAASIRQIYRYATWFDILLVLVGCVVAVITGLGFPFLSIVIGDVSKSFIDYQSARSASNTSAQLAKARHDFEHQVIQGCLKYVYIGIVIMISSVMQVSCFMISCENICNKMRRAFFTAIMRQEIAWFDKNHSGTLATKLFDSMERVREGLGDKMGMMIQFVAQFFGGLVVALTYNWKLTLIMMSLAPFMVICGAFIAKLMASATAKEAKKYAVAGKIAEEVLTSTRTVLSFNGQQMECERYDAALEAGKIDGIKKSFYIGIGLGITMAIIFSSYCLAFWVGTDYIYHGHANSADVLTVFFSVMMGSMALGQAGPQFATFGTALGAAGVIIQIVDREPEIDSYSKEGKKPSNVTGRIEVNDLRFTYPSRKDVPILKGVSITCNPGETVALVGSSGCGKSTIVGLLLRYYNPDSGSITIDGIPIQDYNIEFLRRTVAVVSQEPILFNSSILENLRHGNPNASEKEINSALKKANALDFINSFPQGLNTLVGDRGAQMSGGQKQRIAIARALLRDPKILLLDEATSALDAESESVVQEALENASVGRTTLVIAHRLSTIRNADKIIAMKAGEVVEVGTHDELLEQKGLYHELVNAQVFADVDGKKSTKTKAIAKRRTSRRISTMSHKSDNSHGYAEVDSEDEDAMDKARKKDDNEKDVDRLKRELKEENAVEANLFKILKYARPEWLYLVVGTINCIIQGVVFPVFSLFFSQIMQVFSEITTNPEKMRRDGHHWALMFLLLAAVQAVTMVLQATMYGIAAERLTMRLRSKVFRNVMRQDGEYFDMPQHSAGKISTRLATDAPNIKSAIDYRLGSVFNAAVGLIVGIGIAFYYGWQMALLMLGLFPFLGIGEALQAKMFEGRSAQDAKEMESSGKVAMEAIENIRTVQALTLEARLHEKFCHFLEGPHNSSRKKAILQGITFAIANSLMFFMFAAEFRFGCWLVVANHIPNPINVMRVLFAIQFSATSIGFASAYFPEYMKAKFAAGLIFKMLGETPKIDNMTKDGTRPPLEGSITLRNVHFTYPQRMTTPILKGLDLDVKPGQTLALVGPSGCGKSTVIQLLERFYDPVQGDILVDGVNIRDMNPQHLRSHMALVSQEPILFDCSIKENIAYGLDAAQFSEAHIIEAARKANIHKFVSELPLGYDTSVGDKGTQLSGGQKQRIAIARALIRNPKILLLDEATSALDTESEKLVQDALDAASEGRTCIVIAHRLSTVVNAHCILVCKGGLVIEKGTHAELMKLRGAYYELTIKQQTKTDATLDDEEEPTEVEKF